MTDDEMLLQQVVEALDPMRTSLEMRQTARTALKERLLRPAQPSKPLTIPRDVVEAAQMMQDGDYRGPLFLARKVFDWVAAHGIKENV